MLSLTIFTPLLGAILLALIDHREEAAIKAGALIISLITLAAALMLLILFDPGSPLLPFRECVPNAATMWFEECYAWIPQLGIRYHLGLDGISLFLVLLTALLTSLGILVSWSITARVKEFMILILVLEAGMLGVFLALDLFLFYVFWEVTLIPMALLVGIWGHERRVYAAVKFFLYTMAGSVLMLLAILALASLHLSQRGQLSFDLPDLQRLSIDAGTQAWLFLAFGIAFAIKVPLFPLHTWLPDAHVEAPTAGSVLLAGILLKMGAYGFIRFAMTLFPAAALAAVPLMVALALIGILYGALVAWRQADAKRLVAYSSVSHLGFVMLGLFVMNAPGMAGGLLQMVNHGLSTGALFILVGFLYERRHTRAIAEFGGLWKVAPKLSLAFLIVALSSLGLPGLNGFVGEFLILVGTFLHQPLWAAIAATGVILSAVYLLSILRRMIFGALDKPDNVGIADLSPREAVVLATLIALIVLIGVYPGPFLERVEPSVSALLEQVEAAAAAQTLSLTGR
ncbi:MAG: NADH-quinone oxidoreductase subunit M [Chloroflexi bacterium]|nr:NADH-quinone oxidoreductase subunit M [Chloroflexota bacterium]